MRQPLTLVSFLATIMHDHFPLFANEIDLAVALSSFMLYSFSASTEASALALLSFVLGINIIGMIKMQSLTKFNKVLYSNRK